MVVVRTVGRQRGELMIRQGADSSSSSRAVRLLQRPLGLLSAPPQLRHARRPHGLRDIVDESGVNLERCLKTVILWASQTELSGKDSATGGFSDRIS